MRELVCVSGPHGGGKTTLINRLLQQPLFRAPSFEIDFLSQFHTFEQLHDWERSLVRLYHRIFMASVEVDREPGYCVLVSRGPLDSEAYIETYHDLGWIRSSEYEVLRNILDLIPRPVPTILVMPPVELVEGRLRSRISQGVRSRRDQVFAREDSPEFVAGLHAAFARFENRPEVLVLRDNGETDLRRVEKWVARTPART